MQEYDPHIPSDGAARVHALRQLLCYVRERFEYAAKDMQGRSIPVDRIDDHDLEEALREILSSPERPNYFVSYADKTYKLFHIQRGPCGFHKFPGFAPRGLQSPEIPKEPCPTVESERLLSEAVELIMERLELAMRGDGGVGNLTAYLSDIILLRASDPPQVAAYGG